MKIHERVPRTVAPPRTTTTSRSPGARGASRAARTAGGILILGLVAGAAGAVTAESLGHAAAGHANGRQSASSAHVAANTHGASTVRLMSDAPWMY